jgi:putative ATPase
MKSNNTPLAERIRPKNIDNIIGQKHLLAPNRPLRKMIEEDRLRSMIFWGPPGCGKTTIARIIANHTEARFYQINAVSSGVKDLREIFQKSEKDRLETGRSPILFIDEIHRFNKAQQDALLSSVESGSIILIGATTENPSFEVISPLLSRCQVYLLKPLSDEELEEVLNSAIKKDDVLNSFDIEVNDKEYLISLSGRDARVLLNGLENAVVLSEKKDNKIILNKELYFEAFQRTQPKYDKDGEEHYNIISAFIKSLRGSDPDAAVYWLARMIDSGEDPKFIARRMIILASEDIGNADPYAITLATSCFTAIDYIGMPEGRIILAQTATYLATCLKSNASYMAINNALEEVRNNPIEPVPLHLRNAVTSLMKNIGYGKDYKYSHDFTGNFAEQEYLPQKLKDKIFYFPTNNGREKDIKERLNRWWKKKQR